MRLFFVLAAAVMVSALLGACAPGEIDQNDVSTLVKPTPTPVPYPSFDK